MNTQEQNTATTGGAKRYPENSLYVNLFATREEAEKTMQAHCFRKFGKIIYPVHDRVWVEYRRLVDLFVEEAGRMDMAHRSFVRLDVPAGHVSPNTKTEGWAINYQGVDYAGAYNPNQRV